MRANLRRVKSLERQAAARYFAWVHRLPPEAFLRELLKAFQTEQGYFTEEDVRQKIESDGASWEDWQPIYDRVVAECCVVIEEDTEERA